MRLLTFLPELSVDLILVLREGSLVEQGTHEELLALDGLYSEMWKRQEGGNDAEVAPVDAVITTEKPL